MVFQNIGAGQLYWVAISVIKSISRRATTFAHLAKGGTLTNPTTHKKTPQRGEREAFVAAWGGKRATGPCSASNSQRILTTISIELLRMR
ncbi:hypothetical protein Mal52_30770 [Symmachiella dynata]|uniref:Uncharacterized protein n=1 Tax=Symmachiella dynata TaxID=2527995 RepID=A0A517ZQ33_9PLAN|nr:hypothetical protein Mal52_30770 [Symmachiella dynata]